ncbi:MAG: GNAT family N-acetyltransferase [Anaerolineales bacterium]
MPNVRFLEEVSLSAWPALQTVFVDGWVLRFSNGFGRRANSVNPLFHSVRPVEDNLAECEALYAARGQRVVFKISPAAQPPGLDDLLAQRGYALEALTSVQTLPFEPAVPLASAVPTTTAAPTAAAGQSAALQNAAAPTAAVIHAATAAPLAAHLPPSLSASAIWSGSESLPDEWLQAVASLTAVPERHQATLRQMLAGLVPPACFASLSASGQIAACGLGVLHGGWLGLFDIVTHPQQRGQGYAQRLIRQLLAWGASQRAQGAYLQVMLNNPPALALYQRLGFKEAYRYWYRVKEWHGNLEAGT